MHFSRLYLTFLLAIAFASCNDPSNDAQEKGFFRKGRISGPENGVEVPLTADDYLLVGKVKSMIYNTYLISEKNGKKEKKLIAQGLNSYDTAGHLIEENAYDGKGNARHECTYSYWKDGRRRESHLFLFERGWGETFIKFKYDDKGNLIEEAETPTDTRKPSRTVITYDSDGNALEEITYDSDGKITSSDEYKYDAMGNQVQQTMKNAEGVTIYKTEVTYDKNGLKTSSKEYKGDKLMGKITYKYLSYGIPLEIAFWSLRGKLTYKTTFKYDKMNNVIEREITDNENGKSHVIKETIDNKYDTVGNMVEQTLNRYTDGKLELTQYSEYSFKYYE